MLGVGTQPCVGLQGGQCSWPRAPSGADGTWCRRSNKVWQLVGWRFPRCVASVREKARRGASSITTQPPSLSSVTRDGALEVQRAGRMKCPGTWGGAEPGTAALEPSPRGRLGPTCPGSSPRPRPGRRRCRRTVCLRSRAALGHDRLAGFHHFSCGKSAKGQVTRWRRENAPESPQRNAYVVTWRRVFTVVCPGLFRVKYLIVQSRMARCGG
nr:uncharacterized protein LOC116155481 [Camelus dromedarius]